MDCHVLAKHQSCSIIFLDTSSSTMRRCSTNSILLLNSVSESAQFCSESAQLHQRVSSILQWVSSILHWVSESAQFCSESAQLCSESVQLCSESAQLHQWSFHFCILTLWRVPQVGPFILHTPWRVLCTPWLCILHSLQERPLYPVSRVYATLSTLESALLCNSEILYRIVILWLCTA